jgi:hypothetical protein
MAMITVMAHDCMNTVPSFKSAHGALEDVISVMPVYEAVVALLAMTWVMSNDLHDGLNHMIWLNSVMSETLIPVLLIRVSRIRTILPDPSQQHSSLKGVRIPTINMDYLEFNV